jgi:hypothetical protein
MGEKIEHVFPVAYIDYEYVNSLEDKAYLNLIVNFASQICIDTKRLCFYTIKNELSNCEKRFVEIVYERLPEVAVDLIEGVLKSDIAVFSPALNQVLYVPAKTKVFLIEGKGVNVYPLISEGDKVSEDTKIFYVVTNKLEVRTVRAEVSGIAIYIGDVVESEEAPQKMLCIVVSEANVRRLPQCS